MYNGESRGEERKKNNKNPSKMKTTCSATHDTAHVPIWRGPGMSFVQQQLRRLQYLLGGKTQERSPDPEQWQC